MHSAATYASPARGFSGNENMTACTYGGSAVHANHYRTNGTGRDTYIFNDNGGFNATYEPVKYPGIGTFSPNGKHSYRERAPVMHAKNLYYRSDGTGRDSYIV